MCHRHQQKKKQIRPHLNAAQDEGPRRRCRARCFVLSGRQGRGRDAAGGLGAAAMPAAVPAALPAALGLTVVGDRCIQPRGASGRDATQPLASRVRAATPGDYDNICRGRLCPVGRGGVRRGGRTVEGSSPGRCRCCRCSCRCCGRCGRSGRRRVPSVTLLVTALLAGVAARPWHGQARSAGVAARRCTARC